MSPYGSISTAHRAEVRVPDDVYERMGYTKEYEAFSIRASEGMDAAGRDRYSGIMEWAEDQNRAKCMTFINTWHNRILQWKEQLT